MSVNRVDNVCWPGEPAYAGGRRPGSALGGSATIWPGVMAGSAPFSLPLAFAWALGLGPRCASWAACNIFRQLHVFFSVSKTASPRVDVGVKGAPVQLRDRYRPRLRVERSASRTSA